MLKRTRFEFKATGVRLILSWLVVIVAAGNWNPAATLAQLPAGTPVFNANAKWVTDKGSQAFNVKAFGAVCDGVTDDAAAINAAMAAANPSAGNGYSGVGVVLIPGGCAIGSTVVMSAGILEGIGLGSPTAWAGKGYLKWIGAAGQPMVQINGWNASIRDLALVGNSSANPSEAIQINRATGIADHGQISNVVIGVAGQGGGFVGFTNGISWTGTVGGDSWHISNVQIYGCTGNGINIQNGNASDIHFDNLMVSNSGIGFYAISQELYGTNWEFGGNGLDIELVGNAELNIQGFADTANGGQFIVNKGGMLTIDGGSFELTNALTTPNFIDDSQANSTAGFTTLKHFRLFGNYAGGTPTILQCPSTTATGATFLPGLRLIDSYGFTPAMFSCPLVWASNSMIQTVGLIEFQGAQASLEGSYFQHPENILSQWTGFGFDWSRRDWTYQHDFWSGPLVMRQVPPGSLSAGCTNSTGSGSTAYGYRVAAVTGVSGASTPQAALQDTALFPTEYTCTNGTLGSSNINRIRIYAVLGAAGFNIYGRTPGAEQFLAFVPANATGSDALPFYDWCDNGSVTPSGALPSSANTTGAIYWTTLNPNWTWTTNAYVKGNGAASFQTVNLAALPNTPVLATNSAGQIVAGSGTSGLNPVTCSGGTCAMNASLGSTQSITLAANGTGTLSNCAPGQQLTVLITEASGSGVGGYTWTWPSNMYGGGNIDPTAGAWNAQSFSCDASGNAWATGPLKNAFNSAGGYLFLDFLNGNDGGSAGATIGSPSGYLNRVVDAGLANHPGTWELASGTVANAGVPWVLSNNTGSANDYTPNTNPAWTVEYLVYPTATSNWTLRFGALGGVTANPPTNGDWFQFNTSVDGNWHCDSANGTNTQDQSSGVAVAQNTWYRLRISQSPNTVTFWVNGVQVCQNTTYYPTAGPLFYAAQSISLSTTSNIAYMDSFAWSRGVVR